ncbi:hypothetical protein OSTOST_02628 [Ostertagia ostertagi]
MPSYFDPMAKKTKAPMFSYAELQLLMELYTSNFERYHGKILADGKREPSEKRTLLPYFAQELSNLGVDRTEKQIEERIKADIKRMDNNNGSTDRALPFLPHYLHRLHEIIISTKLTNGLVGIQDEEYDSQENRDSQSTACTPSPSESHFNVEPKVEPGSPGYEGFESVRFEVESPPPSVEVPHAPSTSETVPRSRPSKRRRSHSVDTRERPISNCQPTELYVEEVKAAILRQRHYEEKINNSRLKKELLMVSLEREKLALEKERFVLKKLREEGGKNVRIVVGFGDEK